MSRGFDRRTQAQRVADYQRELKTLSAAERKALDELPYSSIPDLWDARRVVKAVKPDLFREAADILHEIGYIGPHDILNEHANKLEQESDERN